jgi:hypothetical protein
MNRIYRLVFSKSLGALVAVSEITKGKGKGGGKSSVVGAVVSAATLAATLAIGENALAQSACPPEINGAYASCTIPTDGVVIGSPGNISGADYALTLTSGGIAGAVSNAGTLIGNLTAIRITSNSVLNGGIINNGSIFGADGSGIDVGGGSTVTGGIANITGGIISGNSVGISIRSGSTILGGITNIVSSSTILSGITNGGVIIGADAGISITANSVVSNDITNTGLIIGNGGTGTAITIDNSSLVYTSGPNNAGAIYNFGGI